jgi:antitoxin HicB
MTRRKDYINRSETFDEFLAKDGLSADKPHPKRRRKVVKHTGSTIDSLLKEDGILEKVEAVAIKRVRAWQLAQSAKPKKMSKQLSAARMKTSRRLLDPNNPSVTLATLRSSKFPWSAC